jgi:hypothetical protein
MLLRVQGCQILAVLLRRCTIVHDVAYKLSMLLLQRSHSHVIHNCDELALCTSPVLHEWTS